MTNPLNWNYSSMD